MANETDFSPVDYLKRRIIYYKKKRGSARNWHKDEHFIQQYGVRQIKKFQKDTIAKYCSRIAEYERAIHKLENS